MSRWPNVVLLLTTRCLYGRYVCLSTAFAIAFLSMSRWPYIVLLLATKCLYWGGGYICIFNFELILGLALAWQRSFLLCNDVVVVHLLLCINNYKWTTTKLHSNNNKNKNNTSNKKINLHKLFQSFCSDYSYCYCVILLLLFICSCGSTITDEQHETDEQQQQNRAIYINCSVFKSSYLLFIFQCMTYLFNS